MELCRLSQSSDDHESFASPHSHEREPLACEYAPPHQASTTASSHASAAVNISHAERHDQVWSTWLEALASDAEAALGAALAYQTLTDKGRDAMLTALESDIQHIDVPPVAVFAPLLSVETDPSRRQRICAALASSTNPGLEAPRTLVGIASNGDRIIVAMTPVYLRFVKVTSCRLVPDRCVTWITCEPLVHITNAVPPAHQLDGAVLELVPTSVAVDLIARAIVGHRLTDGTLPVETAKWLRPLVALFEGV